MVMNPAADQINHQCIALTEDEVVGVGKEMEVCRLSCMGKQVHGLFSGGDGVVGGVKQQQRSWGNLSHHLIGFEVKHALHNFVGKFKNRAR